RRAEQLEPSRAGYHILSARILQKLNRNKEAADFTEYVARRWQGPDHNEAVEIWKQLPSADKHSDALILESILDANPSSTKAEGKVTSTACGEGGDRLTLTISNNGDNQTFHAQGGFGAGFS